MLIVEALTHQLFLSSNLEENISSNHNTTFVDLYAGIGAGRLGLEIAGFKCIGFSEINENTIDTYTAIHGREHLNMGDITLLNYNRPYPSISKCVSLLK